MISKSTINRWLYLFIIIHTLVWSLAPWLIRYTLPMDAMEGTTWGHQLEWGYDKNPFLNGWLTALAVKISGTSSWAIYLFSQLSVAMGLMSVWLLGKKMLPAVYTLLAVMLLEGIQYYNLHAIDFNDNTLEVGLWGLTALFYYNSLRQQTWLAWLGTGFCAALSMMTKYYTVVLLLPMFIMLISDSSARQSFKKPAFYAGLCVFLLVCLPHILWLCSHQFITLQYAVQRVNSLPSWKNHIYYPLEFTYQQAEVCLPALGLYALAWLGKPPASVELRPLLSTFDKKYLFWIGWGPLLLTIGLSAFTGMKLRAGWGQPLLALSTLTLVNAVPPRLTALRLYGFMTGVYTLLFILAIGYCISLSTAEETSSANFPGKTIAQTLTAQWHARYSTTLSYVAGSRWLAGNIAYYSKDKPAVYIDWDPAVSAWINEAALRKTGALFVWDLSETDAVAEARIRTRFPRLEATHTFHTPWLRSPQQRYVEFKIALLPPETDN